MRRVPIVPGAILARRYRATALLGRGGMGEVWRCHDVEQRRDVAVKAVREELLRDPGVARLFHAEVVAVARLCHPGIVPVYDLVRDPLEPALLVMAYREGAPLSAFAAAEIDWPFVCAVLTQILEALAYAHARGVLHLDIKPENVLVEQRDGELRTTLLDFGVARVRRPGRGVERWFERDAVIGTVEYMAPEQCAGTFERLGPWTDLFSVGALAFELCCGRRPFPGAGDPAGTIRRLTSPPPRLAPLVAGVPHEFVDLCAVLLANEPRSRPIQAADVARALRAMSSGTPGRASVPMILMPPQVLRAEPDAETLVAEESYDSSSWSIEDSQPSLRFSPVPIPAPPSIQFDAEEERAAELDFTAEAELPPSGAYGLFGLRDLPALGRHEERRAVWNAVRATYTERRPRLVLLEGPVGVGKSRIARDAMERAVELGLCTAMQTWWSPQGAGDEGLRGLLENLLDTRGQPAPQVRARLDFWLDRLPGAHAGFIREVELFLRPPRDAAPDAGLPVRVVVDALARATALRPVLVWLDDVQWSRGEAAALIAALRAREPALPVCVLATARNEEADDRAVCEAITTTPGALKVRVDPLDLAATRRLIGGLLDVDEELCELLATRAEGNPLFVTQLLHQLVVSEAVERRDGRYRLARAFDLSTLPADLRSVFDRRVAQSGAEPLDLAALALVRDRVSLEVAEALGRRLDASQLLPSFEASIARALSSGLLRIEGGAYVWAHGLLREHLMRDLPAAEAIALHAMAAEALALLVDREDVQEERAAHLYRAGRVAEACAAMLDAGLWSARRAEPPRKSRFEALLGWAIEARRTDYEARALAELAYLAVETGDGARADRCIADARALLGPAIGAETASWVAFRHAQIARLQGRGAEGARASEEALALARQGGAGEVERLALIQIGLDHARAGRTTEAGARLYEAADRSRAAGDRISEAIAFRSLTLVEDTRKGLELVERAIDLTRAAGALRIELATKQAWVDLLWRSGRRDDARSAARSLAVEAAARRLRQTVALLALQSAAWAGIERDWADARLQREAAVRWGAANGATIERGLLHAVDLLLAIVTANEAAAHAALDAVAQDICADALLRETLEHAASLASPALAARIRRLLGAR